MVPTNRSSTRSAIIVHTRYLVERNTLAAVVQLVRGILVADTYMRSLAAALVAALVAALAAVLAAASVVVVQLVRGTLVADTLVENNCLVWLADNQNLLVAPSDCNNLSLRE